MLLITDVRNGDTEKLRELLRSHSRSGRVRDGIWGSLLLACSLPGSGPWWVGQNDLGRKANVCVTLWLGNFCQHSRIILSLAWTRWVLASPVFSTLCFLRGLWRVDYENWI
jgi:hypothetical protein